MKNILLRLNDCSVSLDSIPCTDLPDGVNEQIVDALLNIEGLTEVIHYANYAVTLSPSGRTAAEIQESLEHIYAEANAVLKCFNALSEEAAEIERCIAEAAGHDPANGMVPCVFKAIRLDGSVHIGFNFQPGGTEVGERFHYDHGAGTQRNEDAEVVWVMPHNTNSQPKDRQMENTPQGNDLLATANNPERRHPYTDYTLAEAVQLATMVSKGAEQPYPSSLGDLRNNLRQVYEKMNHTWITAVAALELLDAEIDGVDIRAASQLIR